MKSLGHPGFRIHMLFGVSLAVGALIYLPSSALLMPSPAPALAPSPTMAASTVGPTAQCGCVTGGSYIENNCNCTIHVFYAYYYAALCPYPECEPAMTTCRAEAAFEATGDCASDFEGEISGRVPCGGSADLYAPCTGSGGSVKLHLQCSADCYELEP